MVVEQGKKSIIQYTIFPLLPIIIYHTLILLFLYVVTPLPLPPPITMQYMITGSIKPTCLYVYKHVRSIVHIHVHVHTRCYQV